jgi:hypothetical protein
MPEVVDTPAATLHALALRLAERTRQYERQRDSRCVFTYTYCLMTLTLERELPSSGCADHVWITQLAVGFAKRFFDALDQYDAHGTVTPAWHAVFEETCSRYTSVIEDLVLGLTAHIVADLPYALEDVGTVDSLGRSRVSDFHAMNDIIGKAMSPVRRQVGRRYARYVLWLDRIANGHGSVITNFGIRLARAVAWYNVVRLQSPETRTLAMESVQKGAIGFVNEVMRPPLVSFRMALRAIRVVLAFFRKWPSDELTIDMMMER